MIQTTDFLPDKYKKKKDLSSAVSEKKESLPTQKTEAFKEEMPITKMESKPKTDFSDLAKKDIPDYSRNELDSIKSNFSETPITDTKTNIEDKKEEVKKMMTSPPPKTKSKKKNNLMGVLVLFFLVVGIAASFFLMKQNQDTRQKAAECFPGEPYCECNGSLCYYVGPEPTTNPGNDCDSNSSWDAGTGRCWYNSCFNPDGSLGICGGNAPGDPCTQDSYGGDWCDDPTTPGVTELCADTGVIRCQCGPGGGGGWWVIGAADSCNDLCDDAEIDCTDCPPEDPPVTDPPPTDPPTGTPTATPTPIACGDTGCSVNADCGEGLTCLEVGIDGSTQGICAKGENQLFCAANPSEEMCCNEVTPPVCSNIDMLNADNTLMTGDDDRDLTIGDQVKFQCNATGTLDVDFNYEFRILTPEGDWLDLTDTSGTSAKNISAPYTIESFGHFTAQGRVCWNNECQDWEFVPTGNEASCETQADCEAWQICYQPPMEECPEGLNCTQVMPPKYCADLAD